MGELILYVAVVCVVLAVLGVVERYVWGKEEKCRCPETINDSNELCPSCTANLDAWLDEYLEQKV